MGKLKMGHNPLRPGCYLSLSTGAIADMTADTAQEAIEATDNLLSMIVMENFEKMLKKQNKTGEDHAIEIIEAEVRHLIENEFSGNPEGALHWLLLTLSLGRLDFITTEVRKRQNYK
jgi:hypothetical protein